MTLDNYFVYVNDRRHVWRFVYFARRAVSGDAAIDMAIAEAEQMGNEPAAGYMAVPAGVITTRSLDSVDEREAS